MINLGMVFESRHLSQSKETLLYKKLTQQQQILEEILLDILLKKEEIAKRDIIRGI